MLSDISTHTLTWSVTWIFLPNHNGRIFQLTRSRGAWLFVLLLLASALQFQLTRSRGAWLGYFFLTITDGYFNSHAHVERDTTCSWIANIWAISTHTLTWSVTYRRYHITTDDWISTHTLTWSVTLINAHRNKIVQFQLTRSRGAWHCHWNIFIYIVNFNSHAHVERDNPVNDDIVFDGNFNSHAHVERDPATNSHNLSP